MKTIYNIAKAELQVLFYSPIAWLILIIFAVQLGMNFMNGCSNMVSMQETGSGITMVTRNLFSGLYTLFDAVKNNLYLYIPLLTMGLMSRELGSGSINLLYSSPVTNRQIILGKYLSMMIYGLLLMAILAIYVLFGMFIVKDMDTGLVMSGMLGIYLLICAYAAVGLFMSSLTSYQIVAAIGTLAILSVLNFVQHLWQSVAFVRDITYWLSLSGRTEEMIGGFIQSTDILYFIIVTILFLLLTIIRLQSRRQKVSRTIVWGKYIGIVTVAVLLGYISSRPKMICCYDATQTKINTLTPNSQEVMKQLKGGLTITTYNNVLDEFCWTVLPHTELNDIKRFRQYARFKPEMKMRYVYYYDNAGNNIFKQGHPGVTDEELAKIMVRGLGLEFEELVPPEKAQEMAGLASENNRFVRVLERESGEKTFLRIYNDGRAHPGESEITAAFKRLVMKLPKVGFLAGHGERDSRLDSDKDYRAFTQEKTERNALINQGFDFTTLTLEREVPEDIDVLVISDMRSELTPEEYILLDKYIARGGNLLIAAEPRRGDVMTPLLERFGVQLGIGCLVSPNVGYNADLVMSYPTQFASECSYLFNGMISSDRGILMPGCIGLTYRKDNGYKTLPLFMTESTGVWNELEKTDMENDTVMLNPTKGEVEESYTTVLALSRQINGKEQKVMILGDADCISNLGLSTNRKELPASNIVLAVGAFHWLSNGEAPVNVGRPATRDNELMLTKKGLLVSKISFLGVFPGLMLLFAILIWIRRKGR